ncbi:MAG: serine hydrolase [bacterium]|nr:MAG: serine hydrolase [bacterium]
MREFNLFPCIFIIHHMRRFAFCIFAVAVGWLGCSEPNSQNANRVYPEAFEQNIDGQVLSEALQEAESIEALQGIGVARNGVIVAEVYYNDSDAEPDPDLHVMSVTKSIMATLVGIALDRGYIADIHQTVSEFLGAEVDTVNPELGQVTLQQLLTMSAGQDWQELGEVSEFSYFAGAPDQLTYIYQKPVVHTPGTIFNYSDGSAHLVSAILERASEMSTSTFANRFLFGPMGLGDRIWYADNRGIAYGGVGLCIGIHDMIAIGFLYINDGFYNGVQIVSADWIEEVMRFRISTNGVIPFLSDYGYFWWIGRAYGQDFICANGWGGQFIFIVKDLNLVVAARTSWRRVNRETAGANWWNVLNIIINRILPAVH